MLKPPACTAACSLLAISNGSRRGSAKAPGLAARRTTIRQPLAGLRHPNPEEDGRTRLGHMRAIVWMAAPAGFSAARAGILLADNPGGGG